VENAEVIETKEEKPLATVAGHALLELPQDLYIPPDALEVFLETFSGPLDLLLYLIRKNNLDILDIPIAKITAQYMLYVEVMKSIRLELAADYLVMAAVLAEIKSRMLLPRNTEDGETEEQDPRAELIRRLQEYEQFKAAAESLDALPRENRDFWVGKVALVDVSPLKRPPELDLNELVQSFYDVLKRVDLNTAHAILREPLTVRERMSKVLEKLKDREYVNFVALFPLYEGRQGVVVTFLAILELAKHTLIEIMQNEINGPIHVRRVEQNA